MKRNQIRPEWVPSGYRDKQDKNSAVEASCIVRTFYNRKNTVAKAGFKRRNLK
ncbi:hypothetical protein [Mucilaginibacter xinganensis]|uniref:Uncharacterized protein n=1 Tax=Mucilaginibacter xinganensis TaxID=1234841 RepID=A0A223P018_9SPHI|nr:hypothetical protein [Mucilaginibacter xinganensis]ASU35463.1 hypothetical protein MuYL_3578 [Mucilaginibacter xinganensis]